MAEGYPTKYRILAQNDDVMVTLEATASTVTAAKEIAEQNVSKDNYNGVVVLPIASEYAYDNGHISFCPRCGVNIAEEMGDDGDDYNNDSHFTCDECEAEISVSIEIPESEDEDDDEEED